MDTVIKRCSTCKQSKPRTEFYYLQRRGGEYTSSCKECDKSRTRRMRRELRLDLLAHYSKGNTECLICAEHRIDVLDLDHIHGGGIQARAKFKTPFAFYMDLKRRNYPKGIRVLCRNCNWLEWIKRKERNR